MLYFMYDHTLAHRDGTPVLTSITSEYTPGAVSRHDIQNLEHATAIADDAARLMGRPYLGVDHGSHVWPRFDVVEAPIVGSLVSRGFNGDYYPAGTIVSVSPSFKRVATSDGTVFFRRRQSAAWIANGTWAMVAGHRDERNPSF